MNKSLIFFFCLVFTGILNAEAQKEVIEYRTKFDQKTFHWGYYLGLNNKTYKITYNTPDAFIDVNASVGFNVGLVAGLKLHKNITLRLEPGLSSNSKTLTFTHIEGDKKDNVREVESTYLHVPLLVKLNTNRMGNIRPYVIGGLSYDRNFTSNENNPEDNSTGEFRMKTNNFGYEVGLGIDIYMPYFIFSPSIRGAFAINNELVYDEDPNSPWTGPVDFLGTRGMFINLTFH